MAPRTPKPVDDGIAAVLAAKKPKTATVPVVLDPDTDPPTVRMFTMRSIGRVGWEKLVDEHQPSTEEQEAHRTEQLARDTPMLMITTLRWSESFAPALIAASCADPAMTVGQAEALWDDPAWSAEECKRLFDAALEVSDPMHDMLRASLGKGWSGIPSSATSSKPPTTTGSRGASS